MSGSLLDEKENFNSTNEVAKEEEVFSTSSILKPSQKENVRQLTAKKPPKVTFKNTPVRHCPTRYKVEQPIKLLDTWEEIRCLDEVENWTERTQVVTKEDHQLHLDSAKEFLDNIIDNLSCFRSPKKHIIFESYKEKDSSSPTEDKSKIMDDALDIAGPLDPAIASLNSLLKAGEEEERAFSPIGSGKASPDCDNMVTSDDIEKLLAPHDVPDEIEIPTLELLHGNKIDAFMDSKFSGRHLDEVAAKLNELKLTSTKTNSIYDDNDLLVKPRGSKQSPPTIQSQETKNDSDFDLPVKPRGAKKPVAAVVPQEDKTEDDLPIKPRGAKQPMAAVVPQEDKTDDDFDLPIKPRGAKQPMTAVVPQEEKTEDDFDLPIKPRGAKQPMAAVVPQEEKTEDDFDLPIKPRGAKQPMAAVIPQEEKTDDDFDLPIKPRGAKQPMAAVVPQEEKTDDDLPIKPRGAKQPMATVVPQEEKTEDDFDLPIKPRGAKQPMAAVVPQEDNTEDDFDLPVKPRGMRKSPPTVEAQEDKKQNDQVTENGNDGENLLVKKRQPKTAKKKEADQVNGEENETFKKPMPPKPWKTKKKKAPQSDDPFTIMFAEPAKSISTNDKSASSPAEQKPLSQSNEVNSMETKPSEQDMNITNREMSSSEDGVMLSDQQQDLGFTNDDFKSGNAFSLELDYLEKFGNTNDLDRLSALARQSLYVKFDPLCKGRSPDLQGSQKAGADANFSKQTPGNVDDLLMNTPPNRRAPTSKLASIKEDKAGSNLTSVDRLLTFSPVAKGAQPAETETAKPPSPTESKLTKADDAALVQPLLYSKSDIETAVKKEREALLKQTHEESQVRDMEIQDILSKLQTEVENNSKLKRENDELKTVMKEYEKTMAEMIESTEKDKNMADESKNEIVKERDQLQADLNSVEAAFSDLHRRYEKMKGALENFKKNEEILKKAAQDYQEKLRKSSEKYQMLKKHAEEKIETANIEINRVRRSNDSEMAVMRAALKKEQNKSASLEQAVQQKINENKELTAICDELIQRASGK